MELFRFKKEIEEAIREKGLPIELLDYILQSDRWYTFSTVSYSNHSTITLKDNDCKLLTFTAIWNLDVRERRPTTGYNQTKWRYVKDIRKVGERYFLLTQEAWGVGIIDLDNVIIEPLQNNDDNYNAYPRIKLINRILEKLHKSEDGLFNDYKGQMLDLDLQQLRIIEK